jgi:hypothetical protein
MKGGVPPTARKARTGELTPPGMMARARVIKSSLTSNFVGMGKKSKVAKCLLLQRIASLLAPRDCANWRKLIEHRLDRPDRVAKVEFYRAVKAVERIYSTIDCIHSTRAA